MGPAEIVESLRELCETEGPKLTTDRIVRWIAWYDGFEPEEELLAFARKMKARQYARQLTYDDAESGRRVKRLWSFRDSQTGERCYHDIAQLSPERRRRLIQQYLRFNDQLRTVHRAMNDYLAGQGFFEFYTDEDAAEPEVFRLEA